MGVKEWGTQDGSSFMRIRVLVDTSQPLCRGRKICLEDGTVGWVRFKYERLPNLCYWCGLLTHSNKDCDLWVQSRGSLIESDQQYGGWLRAPSANSKKCLVVRVEGSVGLKAKEVHSSSLARGEEMDTSEIVVVDRCKENENQEGLREEQPGSEVNEVGPDPMPEQNLNYQQNFEDKLNEIDVELARFDGNAVCEGSNGVCEGVNAGIDVDSGGFLTASVSTVQEKVGECVTEIVVENGVLDETEVRGGPVRTWKQLAREKVALDKDSPPLTVKRGIQDSLEGLEDMVPKKRRCANIKNKETVEAGVQPRRGQ